MLTKSSLLTVVCLYFSVGDVSAILFFVFQECNLYQLIKDRERLFSETEVRNWCFQVFQGLAYMHQRGYFHRDLKPGNDVIG